MHGTEVIAVERRRRWSWTDKQQIVDETLIAEASISAVARRYGLHPSQVFAWRKAAREEISACRACDRVVQPPAPNHPIARGRAGAGLLAHIVMSKYDDHLPLYRSIARPRSMRARGSSWRA
jgi:hypothetical protein